jgi:hypothetical protein
MQSASISGATKTGACVRTARLSASLDRASTSPTPYGPSTSTVAAGRTDAPLSLTACLGLVALLHDLTQAGSQAIIATHSPIVAAVPGANILELGDWGIRPARWGDLHLVGAWRRFLTEPASYFRHLLAD